MIRSKNSGFLNFLLNHSAIYPVITHDFAPQYIDVCGLLEDEKNIFLRFQGGGILFLAKSSGIYSLDTYFLPRYRGAYAFNCIKKALSYLFLQHKAQLIIAEAPDCNRVSQITALKLGFQHIYTVKGEWMKDGIPYDLKLYVLSKEKYGQRDKCINGGRFQGGG